MPVKVQPIAEVEVATLEDLNDAIGTTNARLSIHEEYTRKNIESLKARCVTLENALASVLKRLEKLEGGPTPIKPPTS